MDPVFRTNFYVLSVLLFLSALSSAANAEDMKIHYHCTSEKPVEYRHTKEGLGETTELYYTPEAGDSLNLVIGKSQNYILWVRKPYRETKRFITVLKLRNQDLSETLDLGEEGESATAVFPFEIRDSNSTLKGSCTITAE